MISLSRLIKSAWNPPNLEEEKVISIKVLARSQQDHSEAFTFQSETEYQKIVQQATEEAQTIINKARQEADTLIEQVTLDRQSWEQEKAIMAEDARQSGFNLGIEQGRANGYQEYCELVNVAKNIVDSSKQDYFKKVESSEQMILNLGLIVAEKILGKKIEEDPEVFLSIVKRALKEARDYREIQIHIHPVHYDLVLSQKEELIRIFPKETDIYVYPDDDLHERDCIIESTNGRIDASVDSQLVEIKTKLIELLESEHS